MTGWSFGVAGTGWWREYNFSTWSEAILEACFLRMYTYICINIYTNWCIYIRYYMYLHTKPKVRRVWKRPQCISSTICGERYVPLHMREYPLPFRDLWGPRGYARWLLLLPVLEHTERESLVLFILLSKSLHSPSPVQR